MATQGNVRVPFFSLRSRRLYVMSTRGAREISVARPDPSHLLLSDACYKCYSNNPRIRTWVLRTC